MTASRQAFTDSETQSSTPKAAARGDAAPVTGFGPIDESPSVTRGNDNTSLQLADSLRRIEDLAARLTELAQVLGGRSGLRAPT